MKSIYASLSFLFLLLFTQSSVAQVNIQVAFLPPYQSDLSQYGSRPDLVMINLVNTSSQEQSIQLHGIVTGDNGISLSTKANTRSSQAIVLPPLGTVRLNGMEIANIFDLNQLDMVGITARDFASGRGLPEGEYTFCVRAYDYNDLSIPLSAEEPQGCTFLSINDFEPPIITSPYTDQEISAETGSTGFNISWMTTGAPMGVEYHLKIVEILGDQNPQAVFESANPVFEAPVQSNFYFYGPQNPPLVPGRRYVMSVSAKDPTGKTHFRNNGQSELVVFTYGHEDTTETTTTASTPPSKGSSGAKKGERIEDNEYATNRIKGKLLWGFIPKFEHILGSSFSSLGSAQGNAIQSGQVRYSSNTTLASSVALKAIDPTAVFGGFSAQGSATGSATASAAGIAATQTSTSNSAPNAGLASVQMTDAAQFVATSGTNMVNVELAQPLNLRPAGDAPLPGVSIKIQGVRGSIGTSISQRKRNMPGGRVTLATGKSDSNGEFAIELINPKYANNERFTSVEMVVNSPDFKSYRFEIDLEDFERAVDIEIGEHVLTAKTFEFEPSFVLDKAQQFPGIDGELEVTIYRKASDIEENSYLRYEGSWSGTRERKTIGSTEYVGVARKTITLLDQKNSNMPKLFYSNSLRVEIKPKEPFIRERSAALTVSRADAQGDNELVVKPEYVLSMQAPTIHGTVAADLGGLKNGIENAYVQVTYNQRDVIPTTPHTFNPLPFNPMQHVDVSVATNVEVHTPGGGLIAPGVWNTTNNGGGSQVYSLNVGNAPGQSGVHQGAMQQVGTQQAVTQVGAMSSNASLTQAGQNQISEASLSLIDEALAREIGKRPHTEATDSKGEYTIRNLPLLKKGASYTVKLVHIPTDYRHMQADTAGRDVTMDLTSAGNSPVDFSIDATKMTLKGQLVDAEGNGLYMRNMRIRNNKTFNTDENGNFEVESYAAAQIIDIKGKLGYMDTVHRIAFTNTNNIPSTLNVGKIGYLKRRVTKALFTVVDKDQQSTVLKEVEISFGDTTHHTNTQGQWLYEGPGGKAAVTFIPPPESGYVATEQDIDLDDSGEQKEYIISLEKGVKLFGTVQSGGQQLANSTVTIDDKTYLKATTDSTGTYALYAPKSDRTRLVKAAKTGYYSEEKEQITDDGEVELNFTLRDGGGRNISTFLGFDIELDKSEEEENKTLWTGKFVNLEAHSSVFEGSKKQSLAFKKVEVSFDAEGNATPKDNVVKTSTKKVKLKLFDYLPVFLNGEDDNVLKVQAQPDGMGSIAGLLQIDVKQWVKNDIGININNIKHALLKKHNTSGPATVEAFNANSEETMPQVNFVLSQKDTAEVNLELFGFEMNLDLTRTIVSQNGFATAGYVKTPEIGLIKADSIGVDTLKISRQFGLEKIAFDHDLPTLTVGEWVASLGKVSMDEFGFSFDGDIDINKKKGNNNSNASNSISFKELAFTKEGLFGGEFKLPQNGLSIQGLVNVKAGSKPLSFQKKSDEYSLAGSAKFKFDKLITKEITLKSFEVQTDGKFFVDVPVDYSVNMGFASYRLDGISIANQANTAPRLTLNGEFKVSGINAFKMSASDINYSLDSDGQLRFAVDSISAEFKTPIFEADFALGILDSTGVKGFSGKGAFAVPETQISAAVEFAYRKYTSDNTYALSAGFRAGAVIPIGAVTIDSLGGGFNYDSRAKKFGVNIGGNASIANADRLARLKDVKLGVTSNSGQNAGIVVQGSTDVEVASIIDLATAEILMDTHAKQFIITVDAKFEPVDHLAKLQVNGDLIVQWHPDDTYVFLGAHAEANMLKLIKGQADFAIGVNVKKPRSHPMTKDYFTNLDSTLANHTFTGAYINGQVEKKVEINPDIWIASAHLKIESSANGVFFVNLANGRELLLRLNGSFGLEASLKVLRWQIAGFRAGACFGVEGGYQSSLGWNFEGYAGAYAAVTIGTEQSCNDYTLNPFSSRAVGVTVCFDAYAHLKYRNSNFSFSGHLGDKKDNNCY